eukprot:scaffold100753_cov65-Phaeocystis_antarctica.AAC.1
MLIAARLVEVLCSALPRSSRPARRLIVKEVRVALAASSPGRHAFIVVKRVQRGFFAVSRAVVAPREAGNQRLVWVPQLKVEPTWGNAGDAVGGR